MELQAIARVLTEARIVNVMDLFDADRGSISKEDVREVIVSNALVDTGATTFNPAHGGEHMLEL